MASATSGRDSGSRPTRRASATTIAPVPAIAVRLRALRRRCVERSTKRCTISGLGSSRYELQADTRAGRPECRCGQWRRGCRRALRPSPDPAPNRRPRTRQNSAPSRDRSASACARARRGRHPGPVAPLFASRRDCISGSTEAWRSAGRSRRASAVVTTSGAAVSRSSSRHSDSARSTSGKSCSTVPSMRPSSRPGKNRLAQKRLPRLRLEIEHRASELGEHDSRERADRAPQRASRRR